MRTSQGGIFALGTVSHAYLEFDVSGGGKGRELVAPISSLREPRTTMGGVNLVAGFRPELWREAVPDDAPAELEGFNEDLIGIDDFVMPATQHDAVLWLSGSAYDVIFDVARETIAELGIRTFDRSPDRLSASRRLCVPRTLISNVGVVFSQDLPTCAAPAQW